MKRYLLQQPMKLECLAIAKVGDWITLQAETLMLPISELDNHDSEKAEAMLSREIGIIRNYLNLRVPKMFYDRVVAEAIRALKETGRWPLEMRTVCQMNVITRMIETLFSKHLTSLSLTSSTFVMFQTPFCSKSFMLTGLAHLELNAGLFEADIILFLTKLHSLKYLSIAYCTDDILKCIAENCKLIENLDLSGTLINNNSIYIITKLRKLRIVDLFGTLVDRKGIERLLISCANIECINVNHTKNTILDILKRIAILNPEKRFKLRSYSSDTKQLQLAIKMCPLIQNIRLFNVNGMPSNFKALISLQNLQALSLSGFSFHDQVKELLRVVGWKLVSLDLENDNQLDLNALVNISQMCSNLQSLSLDICSSKQNVSTETKTLKNPPFRNLKELTLKSSMAPNRHRVSVPAFDEQIFFLLSNCLNVECISIGSSLQFTENIVSKILQVNPLFCLKKFSMWRYDNIVATILIDHIIQNGVCWPEVIEFKQIF